MCLRSACQCTGESGSFKEGREGRETKTMQHYTPALLLLFSPSLWKGSWAPAWGRCGAEERTGVGYCLAGRNLERLVSSKRKS